MVCLLVFVNYSIMIEFRNDVEQVCLIFTNVCSSLILTFNLFCSPQSDPVEPVQVPGPGKTPNSAMIVTSFPPPQVQNNSTSPPANPTGNYNSNILLGSIPKTFVDQSGGAQNRSASNSSFQRVPSHDELFQRDSSLRIMAEDIVPPPNYMDASGFGNNQANGSISDISGSVSIHQRSSSSLGNGGQRSSPAQRIESRTSEV